MDQVLAVDIGGTTVSAGLVDPAGTVSGAGTIRTRDPSAGPLWDRVRVLLDEVSSRGSPEGVGVGCVGPMVWPDAVVSPLNVPEWRDFSLGDRLAEAYPGVPVRVHNDAVAAVVGEHWRGAGRDVDNVLGLVVSTGVGGGVILGGRLVTGGTGNAGHIGHVVVEPDGPPCSCGGHGCVESVAAAPALVEWATRAGWTPPPGQGASARAVAASAGTGDPVAVAALERAGHLVGRAIASAVAVLDVDAAVVGGGVSRAGPVLFDAIRTGFDAYARLGFARRVRIEPARLGTAAGLVGAAAFLLAGDRYWTEH